MNYELLKQLKDAGFPQHGGMIDPHYHDGHEDGCTNDACCPTLSELIEACGDGLERLEKTGSGSANGKGWECGIVFYDYEESFIDDDKPYGQGATPEIAVAKLWLALNEKKHEK